MGKKISKKEIAKKVHLEEVEKKGKKTASEFKKFISQGNVINLAVGVIIGDAFGKIVTSIVNDILMPIIGALIGGINFSNLSVTIGEAKITYGNFIQNVIDFFIIAICIFCFVKVINKLTRRVEEEKKEEVPKKSDEVILLEEIRDLLKEKNK